MYTAQVLEHFEHPRNVGELPNPSASAQVENPACGDIMRLCLQVEDGRIVQARFRARGCVAAIACGSLLTELLSGKTISEAHTLRRDQLVSGLGALPRASMHASHLAIDVLGAALKQLAPAQGRTP